MGSEFLHSWWFYGAYEPNYPNSLVSGFDIGFIWVMVSATAAILSVVAVLRVLLNAGMNEEDDQEYAFSKNALANFNHSLNHPDAVSLQTNSLMIELHTTLLAQLDKEAR